MAEKSDSPIDLTDAEIEAFAFSWVSNYGTGSGPEDKAKMLDGTYLTEEQADKALAHIAKNYRS